MNITFKKKDNKGIIIKYYFTIHLNEFKLIEFYTTDEAKMIKFPYYETPTDIKIVCDEFIKQNKLIKKTIDELKND